MRNTVADEHKSCPVCGSGALVTCFEAKAVPVHCNVLCTSREQALTVPRGDIHLLSCGGCSHVFNANFDESLADYTGAYENSLHYSPTFRAYAEDQAAALIKRYDLHGKTIIEIGCGDAYFLRLLCRTAGSRGIGFEPREGTCLAEAGDDISIVRDYYSDTYADVSGDLVCCRQVLEHIPDPVAFLSGLRRAVSASPEAVVFFEVPNASCIFREGRIWDVIYEHFSYFTARSLKTAFARAGFRIQSVEESFGGQYLCAEAVCGDRSGCNTDGIAPEADPLRFAQEIDGKLRTWQSRLNATGSRRHVVWGAGSKGATFLNLLDGSHHIDCVIDLNPRKHGMFVPGTGHRIGGPDDLKTMADISVLLMNPLYECEVRSMVQELGVDATMEVV